ncbi:SIMPL domain-containing protein [Weeksellaceae bacterium TAE3-ERU29]|nr:SIMPL domain-containing protein [Weeksellaceae bacterium TAE3-ERU29]
MKKLIILFSLMTSFLMAQKQIQPTVSVSGKGIITVVPDMVNISVKVVNEGQDVKVVKAQNDKAVSKVLKFLESSGIDKKDYKTEYVDLGKPYNYEKKEYAIKASQGISILLKDIKKYDAVMQGLLESGVNQINNVKFEVSDKSKYYAETRKKAILNAQQKAKEYAEALGQSIGKAVQITDNDANVSYQSNNVLLEAVLAPANDSPKTPSTLITGTLAMESEVNVSFELK